MGQIVPQAAQTGTKSPSNASPSHSAFSPSVNEYLTNAQTAIRFHTPSAPQASAPIFWAMQFIEPRGILLQDSLYKEVRLIMPAHGSKPTRRLYSPNGINTPTPQPHPCPSDGLVIEQIIPLNPGAIRLLGTQVVALITNFFFN